MKRIQRFVRALCVALTPVVLASTVLVASAPLPTQASSHREAPLISNDPQADTTDVYAFIHPEHNDSVTIVGNWIPLEAPYGGPNFHMFSDNVLYELHVDNVGDAKSHITYQFQFTTKVKNPATFLYNTGEVTSLNDPDLNVTQSYTVTEIVSPNIGLKITTVLASNVPVAPANVGRKSMPNYDHDLGNAAAVTVTNGLDAIRIFAGPRDDPFFVDLGSVFDLLTLRGQAPPVGYAKGSNLPLDGLSGYNVHSIVIQVPISRLLLTAPLGETVIGVWGTSSRRETRVLAPLGGVSYSGDWVQVSRLGMPLVNEAVLPRALKDAFNGLKPEQDYGLYTSGTPAGNLLQTSVLTPELQTLLSALYNVPHPSKPRTDLQSIFLTGIKTTKTVTITTAGGPVALPPGTNVNQPAAIVPAEMIRLNTAPLFRPGGANSACAPTPNYQLGLLGGDACGFPNGRRLGDDVTDIELLAVAGAAYPVLTSGSFDFNPALISVLSDNVSKNDKPFLTHFPYVASPWSGSDAYHQSVVYRYLPPVLR